MWLYHGVTSPNDADGMANSVDPDQTLIWVCTICPGLSVQKFRIITVTSGPQPFLKNRKTLMPKEICLDRLYIQFTFIYISRFCRPVCSLVKATEQLQENLQLGSWMGGHCFVLCLPTANQASKLLSICHVKLQTNQPFTVIRICRCILQYQYT